MIFAALIVRLIRVRLVVRWSFIVSRFAIIVQECSVLARRNRYYCVFDGLTNSTVSFLVGFSLSWVAAIVVLVDSFRSEIIDWTEGSVSS